MARRSLSGVRYLVVWLVVVAVASTVAWYAIGRSGSELAALDGTVTTPRPFPTVTLPTNEPTDKDSNRPTGSSTLATAPQDAQRTLTTRGGRVTLRCRGDDLDFRAALPEDGWSIEGPQFENGALELKFVASNGGEEIEIYGQCRDGRPTVRQVGD